MLVAVHSNSIAETGRLEAETIEALRDRVIHEWLYIVEPGDTIKFLQED